MLQTLVTLFLLGWGIGVHLVGRLGVYQLKRHYRSVRRAARVESFALSQVPHVTIIRPIRGLEPELRTCLEGTFLQTYPRQRTTIYLCLPSRTDPAHPIAQNVVDSYPNVDAQIFFEDEDSILQAKGADFGPNPKIRNMSRAYREAKGDIVWIIDCNVWVGKGTLGHMVDTLCGLEPGSRKQKFVHQLPLVVDITSDIDYIDHVQNVQAASTSTAATQTMQLRKIAASGFTSKLWRLGGGRLEEMFLASAHDKWYTAINTVLLAPCIVGKSNMFRRSQLNELTIARGGPEGIDFFSHNICEDHLIGDLLWKEKNSQQLGPDAESFGLHALVYGDLAIQPMAGMSVPEYFARRARWLRVRKFTVTAATFVEPGTESILDSIYLALGVVLWFSPLRHPIQVFISVWLLSMLVWVIGDWDLRKDLHSMKSVDVDDNTPFFARRRTPREARRPFKEWIAAWLGRELLTLPIWLYAVYGGVTVVWRGQKFRVGMDMRVKALPETPSENSRPQYAEEHAERSSRSKTRQD